MTDDISPPEARLRAVEDQLAIYQVVSGYGYAIDGRNKDAVGDHASANCHTMVAVGSEDGFVVGRLSASRLELSRTPEGVWQIDHRQNYMLQGDSEGPALLARAAEGPAPS